MEAPDLSALLNWSEPKEVATKRGPRILRKCKPDEEFWLHVWPKYSREFSLAGFSPSKDLQREDVFWLCWWQELDPITLEQRAKNTELSRAAESDFEPPKPEGLEYRPFQKVGVQFCLDKPGAFLADEMGLGKTIQAIGVINAAPEIEHVLVITKASLKENWQREIKKWLVRPLETGIATGQSWPRRAAVVIANYDIVHRHYHSLREQPWDLVILDESHTIKNPKAKRTMAIVGYRPSKKKQELGEKVIEPIPARRRLALSGTPIENSPQDLWTVLNYLEPERFPSYYSFAIKYCGMHKDDSGRFTMGGEANLELMQRVLRSTIMIRRAKSQVMTELPPKTRMIHELDVTGLESFIQAENRTLAEHRVTLESFQAYTELAKAEEDPETFKNKIRQLGSVKFAFDELAKVRHDTAVACVPQLIELLKEDAAESKILVFGHHKDVLLPLHAAFPWSVLITGSTPAGDRQSICDKFQNHAQVNPFFGSTRACGEGLNLTAAKMVVFVEEDWSPGKVSQAEDRCHRIGQRDNVLVKHYVLPGGVGARMLQVTLEKQELIDRALNIDPDLDPVVVPHRSLGRRTEIIAEGMLINSSERMEIWKGLQELHRKQALPPVEAKILEELMSALEELTPGRAALARRLLARNG